MSDRLFHGLLIDRGSLSEEENGVECYSVACLSLFADATEVATSSRRITSVQVESGGQIYRFVSVRRSSYANVPCIVPTLPDGVGFKVQGSVGCACSTYEQNCFARSSKSFPRSLAFFLRMLSSDTSPALNCYRNLRLHPSPMTRQH